MSQLIVDIYRSARKEGMYLYVRKGYDLGQLPAALLTQFGRAEHAMAMLLTAQKKLARADAKAVIAAVETQAYYLQMPPSPSGQDDYMQQIPNSKL
ncbi:YcgL domain-containing protein [Teredinibacter turnerae]|uniref:YcgL domain-containing protein n=1 Tax=Teredinibacter turnerae TaxID=2426 RepID=UPI00037C870F|nr:YcgL domain-containing protein [Teredinibacter turnerae]